MNMGGDATSCPYREPTPTFSIFSHPRSDHITQTRPRQNVYVLSQNTNPPNHLHTCTQSSSSPPPWEETQGGHTRHIPRDPPAQPAAFLRVENWLQKLSAQSLWPSWGAGRSGSWLSGE